MNKLAQMNAADLEALCAASLKDFCNGYLWMFERALQCSLVTSETVSSAAFCKATGGIIAVNNIAYAGEVSGSGMFQIVLERNAVFSLGGITVMLPILRIKEDCASGKADDAKTLSDAVGEVGNLLTGSFSKVFRAGCKAVEGMGDQFTMSLRLPILLGEVSPPEIGESGKLHVFTYELTTAELKPFRLKIVFPAA